LPLLDEGNKARAAVVERYRAGVPPWCVPVAVDPDALPVYHLAVVQVPDRAAVTRALDAAGIGWGIHYPVPCHRQPAFAAYADPPPLVPPDHRRRSRVRRAGRTAAGRGRGAVRALRLPGAARGPGAVGRGVPGRAAPVRGSAPEPDRGGHGAGRARLGPHADV